MNLLITGGTGEIGHSIISLFKEKDYSILAPTRQELNMENAEHIQEYANSIPHPIHTFIHCAGFNNPKKFVDITEKDLEKTMSINALAFFHFTNALVSHDKIATHGSILGISSIYSHISRKQRFSYTASKHCLNGMIKTLALELAAQNIKVNALSPGFVATRMTYQNNTPEKIAELTKKIPLGKMASPKDIAYIAYFLCSKFNTYITGQNIIADGGYTIGGFEE